MALWLSRICQIAAMALVVVCAVTDVRSRRIANRTVGAAFVVALLGGAAAGWPPFGTDLVGATVVLALGLIGWMTGVLGGGDAKLAAVAGALVGGRGLLGFFLVFSLISGLWAAVVAVRAAVRRDPDRHWQRVFGVPILLPARVTLPLAVPMAAGTLVMLLTTHWIF